MLSLLFYLYILYVLYIPFGFIFDVVKKIKRFVQITGSRLKTTAKLGGLARAMSNRFYFDELYEATVIKVHDTVAAVTDWFDRWLIGFAAVRGTAGATDLFGRALRLVQNGNLQTYAFLFVLGVAVVLFFVLGR